MNQSVTPSGSLPAPPANVPVVADPIQVHAPLVATESLTPHEVERDVMLRLQSHPSLRFSRLNVHQCGHDSICLEGFLESNDDDIDLCDVVRGIHGIKQVVNHVLSAQSPDTVPPKG